ncbi:MAG: enoyl-CoA hydratase/isomerase family protein [Acidimicrobiales bacterium]
MSEHRIVVEDRDGVRLVAFDRPETRNAFDAAMYDAVTRALSGALEDDAIRTVVLTGRGPAFSSGQDLREMAAIAAGTLGEGAGAGFRGLLDLLGGFDKPLLAAVHGVGVGLGCTLLLHVDLVLVEEGARLRVPFAELGVPPEAASSVLLPARVGWQRAAALLLASEWIDAEEMVAAGLAFKVCPKGTALAAAMELAHRIAGYPPHATREIKRLMLAAGDADVRIAREREEAAYAALFADPRANPGSGLTVPLGG